MLLHVYVFICFQGAGGVPDISEILHGTSVLESAVMDLSSAAAIDFINKAPIQNGPGKTITDVHGNAPPSPGGTHVDMPGEHGNTNDFPVLHREHAPHEIHSPTEGSVSNLPIGPQLPNDGFGVPIMRSLDTTNDLHSLDPSVNALDAKSLIDPHIPKGIFHGENVFKDPTNPAPVHTKQFVDLAAMDTAVPVPPKDGPVVLPVKPIDVPVKSPVSKTDGFISPDLPVGGAPIDLGGVPKPDLIPIEEAVAAADKAMGIPGDGFVSKGNSLLTDVLDKANIQGVNVAQSQTDGLLPANIGSVHVDRPGEHGNTGSVPVVHRESEFPTPGFPNIHVDLPGQHGNTGNTPVVHRETGLLMEPVIPLPVGSDIHVDLPGQHGNMGNSPVVHRDSIQGAVPFNPEIGASLPVHGIGDHSVHVDLPGEHGNTGNTPVIHREVHTVPNTVHPSSILPGNQPALLGRIHVDRPGEHGNFGDTPVVHREGGTPLDVALIPPINQAIPLGSVHGDAQVVHREGGTPFDVALIPPINQAIPLGSVHVDRPGEHGNLGNTPVVHREHGHPLGVVPGLPPMNQAVPMGPAVHVDMPGEHGNFGNTAVVHRQPGTSLVTPLPGSGIHPVVPGIVDTHNKPVGVFPTAVGPHPAHLDIHIDAPGELGNPHNEPALHLPPGATIEDARAAGVIPPVGHAKPATGLIPAVDPHIGVHPKYADIHIDAPGEHGNPHNEPALHLPPGATIEDARAAGVIPHHFSDPKLLGPVVPTGVIPGTPNVPVKPTGMGIVGDKSILGNKSGRRRRGGRRRGGRRRGGGRRGGRFDHHGHDHDHHEPTTTKKPPSSGVTVIRVSRPNPLANLANAVRGMLTGGGNGGGLLGSLFRSAAGARVGGPPPGVRVIGPVMQGPGPNNLMNSLLGNLFRGRR